MGPELFLGFADPLPEPMLLLSGQGLVLAGNRAIGNRFGVKLDELRGRKLADVVTDAPDEVARYIRSCARSRSLVLGALDLRVQGRTSVPCRAEGMLLQPRDGDREALLLLRLIPKSSAIGQFVALNLRIEELGKEIQRRRQAEVAAREREEQLHVTLHSIGDAVITTDTKGRVALMNPVAERLTGWSHDEAAGLPLDAVFKVVNEATREPMENPALRALREGMIVGLANHTTLISRHDVERPIADSAAPIRFGQEAVVGSVLVFRDVSEQRRAEAALRESEARFRLLADTIPQLAWVAEHEGDVSWYNRRWYEYTGMTPEELEERGWEAVHDPKVLPEVLDRMQTSMTSGEPFEMVFPLKGADGRFRSFLTRVNPFRDREGRILYWFGTSTDIDEQRQAQEALAESERRFRQLADAMPQIVWTAGTDGQIEYTNRRWRELTGLPESMGNAGWAQILHPDEAKAARDLWAASLRSGERFEKELRLLDRHDRTYRWHLLRTIPVRDEQGNVVRWYGTSTDIHEQKRAAESSRFLAEASGALAGVVDYESTLQKVANLAVPHFADWSAVDMVDDDGGLRRLAIAHQDVESIDLVHRLTREYPPDPESPSGAFAVLRTGRPQIISDVTDEMLERAARDERHLDLLRALRLKSYICVPLAASGNALGVLTFATAESGRRYTEVDLALAVDLARRAAVAVENARLYQALREADRRKDEFLATLAHELRNPLAPIRNSLQILKMPRVDDETRERSRETMERQVQHMVRLVDDLLDVSRVMRGKIELRRERVELAVVVARAVETIQPLLDARGQELNVRLPTESLPIRADPVRLSQVIGNLVANATKFSHPTGRIWLTGERDGDMAVVRLRDEGIGIAPQMLTRIFDLFVQADHASSRAAGGLGIGLTLVRNLVELHDGTVEARSDGPGKGSEFTVRLPISTDVRPESPVVDTERPAPSLPSSGYRLLVVDDNTDAASSFATLLELQGHAVRVAHSGMEALEVAKEYRPDVVFLDIGMPGMDGFEVARRMRKESGLENVVLAAVTGWGQQEDRRRTAAAGFDYHLVKPPDPTAVDDIFARLAERP